MITAQEAKALAEASAANLERYLALIDKEIRERAEKNERKYECYVKDLWDSGESRRPPTPTVLQQRVIDALKMAPNFFGAEWKESGDPYVPRGLADDNGKGPSYQNYCIHIRW